MNRVRVLVEGQTEESFVNKVIAPYLINREVYMYPILFRSRGGSFRYQRARKEIGNSLKEDRRLFCTTLVDFYGMPTDWPGRSQANSHSGTGEKARVVEQALLADVQQLMGDSFDALRFIPYVQMHEFEAILFSDPEQLAESLGKSDLAETFETIRADFGCPEDIDDNYETSPSRRILAAYPEYSKVIDGTTASKRIGLPAIRQVCPHFNEWVCKLEKLGEDS